MSAMKITKNFELGKHMTFELCKQLPMHSWFYYKEGYSPEIVKWAFAKEKTESVFDPFCGVGTTLLAAKENGLQSRGVDSSELAVFISKVKTDDYSQKNIEEVREFIAKVFSERREDVYPKWEFELFDVRAAFPKRHLHDILFLRDRIEAQEGKTRNLLLLGLLSIIPQVSIIVKDGGVLKINRRKRAMPVKEAFRRKIKRMINELEQKQNDGPEPEVYLGDARGTGLGEESEELIVTSPPYLNNIDYSKVYGLELSLLAMSKAAAEETRLRSVRSFIGRKMQVKEMPPEVGEVGEKIPIVGTYFADMEEVMKEMKRLLCSGGAAYIVVSNSVIHQTHVLVDEIFAEMGERIGFSETKIVVGAERIADVKPAKVKTRESIVIVRK